LIVGATHSFIGRSASTSLTDQFAGDSLRALRKFYDAPLNDVTIKDIVAEHLSARKHVDVYSRYSIKDLVKQLAVKRVRWNHRGRAWLHIDLIFAEVNIAGIIAGVGSCGVTVIVGSHANAFAVFDELLARGGAQLDPQLDRPEDFAVCGNGVATHTALELGNLSDRLLIAIGQRNITDVVEFAAGVAEEGDRPGRFETIPSRLVDRIPLLPESVATRLVR
jgi:hypothetical protein